MGERYDLIIKRGTVVLPSGAKAADIAVKDGRIAAIAAAGSLDGACEAAETIDADGLLVMAGAVDVHVHFNEPKFGHWEGFATGSAALAAGGCTTYADMPLNGNPPTVDAGALALKASLAEGASAVDYAFWGGLVPGNADRLEELAAAGVVGFKAFMSNPGGEGEGRFREIGREALREGMRRIAAFGGLLALHAESEAITSRLAAKFADEGRTGARDFAASRPAVAELEAVYMALELAAETCCRLHFVHISTPEAIDMITAAKRRGIDVTAETCPHYLTLTEDDMALIGPAAKCAPPLRGEDRLEGLWTRLLEGAIDLVASDHSPCPEAMKTAAGLSFIDAWGGIAGAQNTLELMLEEGWRKRGVPLQLLSAALSANPARRFGLYPRKGEIAEGFDADLAIIDPNRTYALAREDLYHRHKHSPYIGRRFTCKVVRTLCRGKTVYAEGAGVTSGGGVRLTVPASNVPAVDALDAQAALGAAHLSAGLTRTPGSASQQCRPSAPSLPVNGVQPS
ncbi:allantoinase AllB [Paenibacillus rhizovicinus]|uniref:Allantoinase n=1 Tax=Paenibacillus rhizovicinus TaxID=2704463 RepID=A0A6C0NTB9_9BACL|nr:allantoinase AllB [Paenibacillus rhizovicinus]QHW29460.1 allantoinase AllB [Paenibacillus rhizovicinus]